MRIPAGVLGAVLGGVFATGVVVADNPAAIKDAIVSAATDAAPYDPLNSVVKVMTGDGHGSGFQIGKGYFLTAAHVVGTQKKVVLKSEKGTEVVANVLWSNSEYDVALLQAVHPDTSAAKLDCKAPTPSAGDTISLLGNPADLEFVTLTGSIARSKHRTIEPWESVFIVDAVVVPGMSGGPVLDSDGRVVGITVGVQLWGMGFSKSLIPIGYVVPHQVVCKLMGISE